MPTPADIRKSPVTISFGKLYEFLFNTPAGAFRESIEVDDETAQEIFEADLNEDIIHIEDEDGKLTAWRKEAWVTNAARIIRQKQEDNEKRRLLNLKDEATKKLAKAILKKTGRGANFEETSISAAALIINKKDKMLALLMGDVDLDSEEWRDLIK